MIHPMKNIIVLPLRYLAAVSALLFLSSSLHAGASNKSGNPFGNGTYFPDSGNFSAIVRSSNGFLGVVQFTTQSTNISTNALTNSGIATIYADYSMPGYAQAGEQFVGPAFGTVVGSQIAATYNANYNWASTNGTTGVDTVNGQFTGTLFNTYPTQSFSGNNGEAQLIFAAGAQQQYQTTVSGVRVNVSTN